MSLGIEDKLEEDEVAILGNVLEFAGKTVHDVMVSRAKRHGEVANEADAPQTPMEDAYTLSAEKIVVSILNSVETVN